jgi:Cft2 family RNA processing exonuclease
VTCLNISISSIIFMLCFACSHRHLPAAEIPYLLKRPDVLIVESTYGTQKHPPRLERESRFTSTVEDIVQRGPLPAAPACS